MAQLYKLLIEGNSDLKVSNKTGLGGTKICFDALNNDEIDLYPEYTGTGLLVILKPSSDKVAALSKSADAVFQYVYHEFEERYNIKWLKPIGFNNSYALMMRREKAQSLRIKSISDLKHYINKN